MKKYLPILLLWACNSSSEKASPITVSEQPINDSISLIVDSLKEWTENISDISSYAINAQARIKQLEKEKKHEEDRMPVYMDAIQYLPADQKDEELRKLTEKILGYEREISRLKRKIYYDSLYISRVDKAPKQIEEPVIRPNENSIILQLDRRMKDDGDIPLESITAFILPYDRKAKKWKEYGYCSGLKGKQAELYNGQFFFNDVPPGKYLIKLCTYSGGYKIIERETGLQVVAMQVAPPIQ